MQLVFNKIE